MNFSCLPTKNCWKQFLFTHGMDSDVKPEDDVDVDERAFIVAFGQHKSAINFVVLAAGLTGGFCCARFL